MSGRERRTLARGAWPLVGLIAVAAAFRFTALDLQRFWLDESVTAGLLRLDFGDLLATIPLRESTPPLYYALAWVWAKAFGTGELGLRSLSAVAGTVTVPVVYLAAREFGSRRAAVIAAGLTAVSPALVWYSQEARAYSLAVLLSALTLVWFGRALKEARPVTLALWAATSVLALATHYFSGFLILAEAAVLLHAARPRRPVVLACAPIVAAAAGLAVLALYQRSQGHLDFIGDRGFFSRALESGKVFVAGQRGYLLFHSALIGFGLVAVAAWLLVGRTAAEERRRALPLVAVAVGGTAAVALPVVLGFDYVLARNLLILWPAFAIVLSVGLAGKRVGRLGLVAAAALGVYSAAMCVVVPFSDKVQREAISAEILHLPGQKPVAFFEYVPVRGGSGGSAHVVCDPGYRARSGTAAWLGEGSHPPAPAAARSGPGGRGWSATVPVGTRGDGTYELVVVCVPG